MVVYTMKFVHWTRESANPYTCLSLAYESHYWAMNLITVLRSRGKVCDNTEGGRRNIVPLHLSKGDDIHVRVPTLIVHYYSYMYINP